MCLIHRTKNLDIRIGGEHHIVKDSEGPQDRYVIHLITIKLLSSLQICWLYYFVGTSLNASWILYEPVYMNEEEIEDELAALKDSNRYGYMNGSFAVRK